MIEATVKMLERKGLEFEPLPELYAEYVFWLLHARTMDERANIRACSNMLDKRHFDGWFRAVRDWPEAREEYLRLCAEFERTPEAC